MTTRRFHILSIAFVTALLGGLFGTDRPAAAGIYDMREALTDYCWPGKPYFYRVPDALDRDGWTYKGGNGRDLYRYRRGHVTVVVRTAEDDRDPLCMIKDRRVYDEDVIEMVDHFLDEEYTTTSAFGTTSLWEFEANQWGENWYVQTEDAPMVIQLNAAESEDWGGPVLLVAPDW